jgi:hypothetical protein
MVGGEVDPDHGPERMADEGYPVEAFRVQERDEVGRVGRDAGHPFNLSRCPSAPQVGSQETPARKPVREQLIG